MFNLVSFTTFSILFFKNNTSYTNNILDLIIFTLGLFLYIYTFVLFCLDPDPFDYFRYCFKRNTFSMAYYFFYSISIIGSIVLLQLMPLSWPALIPVGCLFLLILIYRPYRELKDNLRNCFNLLIILGFLSLRVLISYNYKSPDQIDDSTFILYFTDVVLMLVGVIVGLGFVVYHIIYICFLKPNQ